jgi:hypothetical protein
MLHRCRAGTIVKARKRQKSSSLFLKREIGLAVDNNLLFWNCFRRGKKKEEEGQLQQLQEARLKSTVGISRPWRISPFPMYLFS